MLFKNNILSIVLLGYVGGMYAGDQPTRNTIREELEKDRLKREQSASLKQTIRDELREIEEKKEQEEILRRMEYQKHMLNTELSSLFSIDAWMMTLGIVGVFALGISYLASKPNQPSRIV